MSGIADEGRCGSTEKLVCGRTGGKSGLVSCLLTLQRRRDEGEGQGNFLEKSVREKMKGKTFILMQNNSLSGESRNYCFVSQW